MRLESHTPKSQLYEISAPDIWTTRIAITGELKHSIFPNQKHKMQNNNNAVLQYANQIADFCKGVDSAIDPTLPKHHHPDLLRVTPPW